MSDMKKPIRVAQCVNKLGTGGIEALVISWHTNIDCSIVQFDYIVQYNEKSPHEKQIKSLGGHIIPIVNKRHSSKIIDYAQKFFAFYRLLQREQYDIVHFHASNQLTFVYALAAHLAGTKSIIIHSHTSEYGVDMPIFKKAISIVFRELFVGLFTRRYACSIAAAKWMYGAKVDSEVLKNGIEVNHFRYDERVRQLYRDKLKINNKYVVGHVGRLEHAKNHSFLIDIFAEVIKKNSNAILLLVGCGSLEYEIREKVRDLNLSDQVIFYGFTDKVAELMQAMDIFVFPSYYEGLGIAAIESQAAALMTIASDTIPEETNISEYIYYCSLKKSATEWADLVLRFQSGYKRQDVSEMIRKEGYDVEDIALSLKKSYLACAAEVR